MLHLILGLLWLGLLTGPGSLSGTCCYRWSAQKFLCQNYCCLSLGLGSLSIMWVFHVFSPQDFSEENWTGRWRVPQRARSTTLPLNVRENQTFSTICKFNTVVLLCGAICFIFPPVLFFPLPYVQCGLCGYETDVSVIITAIYCQ